MSARPVFDRRRILHEVWILCACYSGVMPRKWDTGKARGAPMMLTFPRSGVCSCLLPSSPALYDSSKCEV